MSARAERNAELAFERAQLAKVELDLELGWTRYRNQQDLVSTLQTMGRDSRQAERLVRLFGETLLQWEYHRDLILQRIAHLEELNRTSTAD